MGESAFFCANRRVSGWKIHSFFHWTMPFMAVFRSGSGASDKKVSRTLRGHFWTLQSPGSEAPQRHPEGHFGPEGAERLLRRFRRKRDSFSGLGTPPRPPPAPRPRPPFLLGGGGGFTENPGGGVFQEREGGRGEGQGRVRGTWGRREGAPRPHLPRKRAPLSVKMPFL